MRAFSRPRLFLAVWLAIGGAALLYVIFAASLSGRPDSTRSAQAKVLRDPALIVGEMEDFVYATEPRRAPAAAFLHDGREITLGDLRGRTVLVNFWATWCAPCLKELPSLDALQGELGGDEFAVVAVAADPKGPDAAQAFLDKLDLENLELYADPTLALTIAAGGGSNVLPVSILYDAEGREIGRITGEADWASPEAKALMKAAIAARGA